MNASMKDIEERTNLTNNNQFELLLFRLDDAPDSELYGINVFKVREILVMLPVIKIAGAGPMLLGMVDIRGKVIPVVDLPRLVSGAAPKKGPNILLWQQNIHDPHRGLP